MSWPNALKPSARVDLLQLFAGIRPAIRTELRVVNDSVSERCLRWFRAQGLHVAIDRGHFVVVSGSPSLSRRILDLDRAYHDHTYRLGRMLGYPHCCCLRAASVGEEGLDRWALELRSRPFAGIFRAIDPCNYLLGYSLISHLPCAQNCRPSLAMASALHFALQAERRQSIVRRPYW